jgi:poly-gamma-glutamate synthesis protein (capsule biosynthesis protein)
MKIKKKPYKIPVLLLVLFLSACRSVNYVIEPETIPVEPLPKTDYLTIIAAGDNLLHDRLFNHIVKDGIYDFDSIYSYVRPFIEKADIAFINQEVLLAGTSFGLSGYPLFNAPQEAGNALIKTGFNVINHASNHIMDKGEAAVFATMQFWDTFPGIRYLGIHKTEEDKGKPVIIEKNNIKTGFLSYTYNTNGIPLPKEKPYLVSLIDTAVMAKEIDALRPLCDFLIVSMHWGTEYESAPNSEQQKLAQFLAEHNVDLVIGHHPHVLQTFSYVPRPDGQTMLCYYSLGNFLAAQTTTKTLLGGLVYLRLKKADSNISIEETGFIPTISHFEKGFTAFKIYPLFQYTDELANKHLKKAEDSKVSLAYFNMLALELFGSELILKNPFIQ